ncbi:MAG: glycosyltransferase family 4 protein [Chloroflexi bacterium]|nr:glycosyltransferase family 4 protein [Chloroflexota bacterium]
MDKKAIKSVLGDLPLTAEIFWLLRQSGKPPVGGYSAERLQEALPAWVSQAEAARREPSGRRVLVFSMLRYWVEQTAMTSLALAALGHDVTLAYLPYAHWKKPVNRFDLRRQDLYLRDILKPLAPLVKAVSLLDAPDGDDLPDELSAQLDAAAYRDTQYSLLNEEVDRGSDLYRMRYGRDERHARVMLAYLRKHRPDAIILPNGSILEFGITFKVARFLDIPVATYEFGEQSERMWLAQNADVMRQDTGDMWAARKDVPLSEAEWKRVKDFFATRQGGGLWENFARRWQGTPSQGGEKARADLGLDSRSLVLLPANVLGDSLTLGRQLFSESMTEWLARTIRFFETRSDIQLVIRVHPGEALSWGPSVYDILSGKFPALPENIHLLPADAKVNTYDLVNAADVGLVFTTTVGMEMAMSGLPVIVTGQTHYRGKGFTLDPDAWDEYFGTLEKVLASPKDYRPSREQVEAAWTYAYRFFFEYPQPFPWHVQHFWDDESRWPMEKVLSEEGLSKFEKTFGYLAGEPMDWKISTADPR